MTDIDFLAGLGQTVASALHEDLGDDITGGDITAALIDPHEPAVARVITRERAVICGRPWVDEVFRQVAPSIEVAWQVGEGDMAAADATLFTAKGPAHSLLTAERTALNFLQLLSGVATRARQLVDQIEGTGATLLDTRKTVPGLRLAQKYAVRVGGAMNHRIGLHDAYLIKENHISAAGGIAAAVARARKNAKATRVEVEVESLRELDEALAAKPDWIMLDNFTLSDMREAAARTKGTGIRLEASGGIDKPEALREIADTGVDYISVGALTKHVRAVDLSMLLD